MDGTSFDPLLSSNVLQAFLSNYENKSKTYSIL